MTGERLSLYVSAVYADNATMEVHVRVIGDGLTVRRESGSMWRQPITDRIHHALTDLDEALRDAAGIIPPGTVYIPGAEGGKGSAGTTDRPDV